MESQDVLEHLTRDATLERQAHHAGLQQVSRPAQHSSEPARLLHSHMCAPATHAAAAVAEIVGANCYLMILLF